MSYRKPYYYEKSGSLDLRGYHPSQWIPILNSTNWEHIKTIQLGYIILTKNEGK